jgi:titin
VLSGNFIGTDLNGAYAVPNGRYGVSVSGSNNTIGGTTDGAGNVISGNASSGINLISGTNNLVAGNYIGTDVTGTTALGNLDGITLNTSNNTIGGLTNQAANVISGNQRNGVLFSSGGTGNRLLGNFIGTDASGTFALANMLGVFISDGTNNTIGGTLNGAGNLISGNTTYGIEIFRTASGNQVQGNLIGTDVNGTAALPNSSGVLIDGGSATNNTIGGSADGARNFISGNSLEGIAISSSGNFVQGNYIGTDMTGTEPLPNAIGVSIGGAGNTIGGLGAPGTLSPEGNLISGNTTYGVFLSGTGATLNRVQGNFIGTDATGTSPLANGYGVFINSASNNTIGGSSAAGNTIAFNRNDGVLVQFATGDAVRGNSIFGNTGQGIRMQNGGNNNQAAPVLTSASSSNGFLIFQGTLTAAVSTTFTIEIFANAVADPSSLGQGERLVAFFTVTTDATGHASFGFGFPSDVQPGEVLTATATDPAGNTSAFSHDNLIAG